MTILYNGTSYHEQTPNTIVQLLEYYRLIARSRGSRIEIEYGDQSTGQSWGDREAGYIGRSTGSVKIPLLIPSVRSSGGVGVLDHCIVRITTEGGKTTLYQHPTYKPANI